MTASVVQLENLGLAFGARTIVRELSLEVQRGEVVAVVGASGSGKTTLLRAVLGLVQPRHGVVRISGAVVSRGPRILVPPEERNLAVVFQDLALWPHLTVARNLGFVLSAKGFSSKERQARIAEWLERVGLADRSGAYPGELSGGERQRVALARALVYEPAALLLDEPFASLDVALKAEVIQLISDLLAERQVPTLLVTHDPEEAGSLAHRVALLEGGEIAQIGPKESLSPTPAGSFAESFIGRLQRAEWSSRSRST